MFPMETCREGLITGQRVVVFSGRMSPIPRVIDTDPLGKSTNDYVIEIGGALYRGFRCDTCGRSSMTKQSIQRTTFVIPWCSWRLGGEFRRELNSPRPKPSPCPRPCPNGPDTRSQIPDARSTHPPGGEIVSGPIWYPASGIRHPPSPWTQD